MSKQNKQVKAVTPAVKPTPVEPIQTPDEQPRGMSPAIVAIDELPFIPVEDSESGTQGGESNPAETPSTDITGPVDNAGSPEPEVEAAPETVISYIVAKHKLKYIPYEIQSIIESLEKYAQFMTPLSPTAPDVLLQHQYALHRAILSAVTMRDTKDITGAGIAEGNAFMVALDVIMWYFRTYKDTSFNELYLHRRLQDLRIDKKQYSFLQLLLSAICMVVNNPGSKRSIKWNAITKELDNVAYQHRVLAYFVNS